MEGDQDKGTDIWQQDVRAEPEKNDEHHPKKDKVSKKRGTGPQPVNVETRQ